MAIPSDTSVGRLDRLADVFGDATRRAVYRHLLNAPEPVTAAEVAAAFGLHRTVARAHLERMVEVGLVEVGLRHRPTGGRPAKIYRPTDERLEVIVPPRRYEPLARLLLQVITRLADERRAEELALEAGRAYGEEVAHELTNGHVATGKNPTPRQIVAWLETAGYGVRLDDTERGVMALEVTNCVYRELSVDYHDLVCCFDRGMFRGLLGASPEQHTQTQAMAEGAEFCRHEFRL
jgi:predicted ArsR family transcriptional regulator